ncbi:uncharacterized protein LOC134209564 [Armigeres subalbatus]|uniref:uncharacterized protein LOC134209564 n=1 Tax=Armigeres subalbatus TaxID=124917 RepID=UPI002ECFD537
MLLTREEVWHVIADPKPQHPSDQWKKSDQKARATIGLCLEESQYSLVKNSTIYSGDIKGHILELEEVCDRLAAAGHVLTESFKIVLRFRSLPGSYQGLATLLQSQVNAGTTMEAIKVKVLEEYERRNERSGRASGTADSEATAMKSATKKSREKSSAVKTCYHCGKAGERDCRALKNAKQGDAGKKRPEVKPSAKKANDDGSAVCFVASDEKCDSWYVDSGASCHMTNNVTFFTTFARKNGPSVVLKDGKVLKTTGCGYGTLREVNGSGNVIYVKLSDVLLVPSLTSGLVSVDKLTSKGFTVEFDDSGCDIRDKTGKVVVVGERAGSLYRLQLGEVSRKVEEKAHNPLCQHQWHRRFGHRHPGVISRISAEKLGRGMKVVECGIRITCEPCIEGKLARNPIPKVAERKSTQAFNLVHTDL